MDEDDEKGGDSCKEASRFEEDLPSMVQPTPSNLDYSQMERMLESEEEVQFDGYVGHWSATTMSEESKPEESRSNPGSEFPQLTLLQSQSETTAAETIPDDPLDMDSLFRQLYRKSYSIINKQPQRAEEQATRARFFVREETSMRRQPCVC